MIKMLFGAIVLSAIWCIQSAFAADEPLQDEINPLLQQADAALRREAAQPLSAPTGFAALFEGATLDLSSAYYGRARHAANGGRSSDSANEIHVNAFGQRVDVRSGYAWGIVGFDVGGQTNLGRGNGWSEVLRHKEPGNIDRSSVSLSQAAMKIKLGAGDFGFEWRGGFTPISIGSLGTSGGLFSHSYRGMETRFRYKGFSLGYGWADRFRNEWDDTYRRMYNAWHQNRYAHDGTRITYAHSIGARYDFENGGFIDIGVGEGRRYRRNMQIAASAPVDLGCWGTLTFTGYGIMAKYDADRFRDSRGRKRETEYHVSGLAEWKTGLWTFATGLGHTRAPNSEEMNFRLTAWGSSDNRNFIQTWGQLDDFVWDGQNVSKTSVRYDLGERICLPGLSVGASYIYSWNARNHGQGTG